MKCATLSTTTDYVQKYIHKNKENLLDDDCSNCGSLPAYTDDTTYVCFGNREHNQIRIVNILERLRRYLNSNKLTINTAKTVLIEFMLPQRRTVTLGDPPKIETTNEIGEDKTVNTRTEALLLGGTFHQSTSWKVHIQTGEEALLAKLRKKLGMLKFIGGNLNKKGKLMLANGYILSKIIYMIPLWGGTEHKYRQKVQIIMNNTARWISGWGKRTNSMKLMKYCNWLNLKELTELHSLTTLWKIVRLGKPRNLNKKISIDENYLVRTDKPRLKNNQNNFRHRTEKHWNDLPARIRGIKSLSRFKMNVKRWIIQ